MNLDPFSKSALDPFKNPDKMNPSASKEILVDNSKKGGGLGRVAKKLENPEPEEAAAEPMVEPEKEKPAVKLSNPVWETAKVGFNEETVICVDAAIPEEHAHKKKIAFELFAKTPKGPERISQGEGMVEAGKAKCTIPVYIPQYKDEGGNLLQKADYYFTAKHSLSELLDGAKAALKTIDEMAERLIDTHIIQNLTFAFDKSFLHPRHAGLLNDMCAKIKSWREKNPEGKMAVFGHADAVGQESYNKALSERRSKSVFAFLMKDPKAWTELDKEEKWSLACIQDLLRHLGHDPGASDGQDGPKTQAAVKEFQKKKAMTEDGKVGPDTREALYKAFMEESNDLALKPADFDDIGGQPHMGCSEYNLVEKTQGECETNRRVALLLLKSNKNFPITYPCKKGDIAPCVKQTERKGVRRTEGFRCLFYDQLVQEKAVPAPKSVGTDLKGRLFWNRTWDYMDETVPVEAIKEFLPGAKVELEIQKAGEATFKPFGSAIHLTDGIDKALEFPHDGCGNFNFKAVPKCDKARLKISLEYEGGKIVCVKGMTFRSKTKFKDEADFKIHTDQTVFQILEFKVDAVEWSAPDHDLGELEITKALFVDICDAYKSVWTGYKRIKELTCHELEVCRINFPEDPKITVSNAGEQMQLTELDLKDRAVILHEYGHFIGTMVLGGLDHPGYGYNDDATQSHGGTTLEHYESAWNEGHATFLSCALTDNPHYHDGYDTTLNFFLDSDGTKLGPHCEGSIQEALWAIYKTHATDFKDGFWKAFTDRSLRTCRNIFDFFDNWRDLKLAKLDKVIEAFTDFGMEFGYLYPSDKFTNVAAPKVFDEAKKEFAAVSELHANKGSLGAGTLVMYNEEFYNRNKQFNGGKLGAGSTIAAPKVKTGKDYIAPVRMQVKA
ncbi:MAG: peptidoglycan-binding protein [Fibrobacterota bacterium]|nr:peptidoglycan-binding protein [Fibrobacterota bacterium]